MLAHRPLEIETDKALGALLGGAIGDAMGMPTQTLSRGDILKHYGQIGDFRAAFATHPVSRGLPAGMVTDDTEQSLLLANQILQTEGGFDEIRWGRTLLAWEQTTRDRGLHDLLGPSTKRALESLMRGVPPAETGRLGATNGAAMRIAPVGIATPPTPLPSLVDRVVETCRITHNTAEAIGAASAVAAAISLCISGAGLEAAFALALDAAIEGERRAEPVSKVSVSARIALALDLSGTAEPASIAHIADMIGTGVAACESVPMAFAVARLAAGDAYNAALVSANVGGDTDTIGAIAAAMTGAASGASTLPADAVALVTSVNGLNLRPVAEGLLAIRARGQARAIEVGR